MLRTIERRADRLRLWVGPEGPAGHVADGIAVEWAGQVGHPSSYALLGGCWSDATLIEPKARGPYGDSLAGASDEVQFGLPDEFASAVKSGLESGRVEVTIAAHGLIGSSPTVFKRVAAFLDALLRDGVPARDDDIWGLWDSTAPP